MVAMLTVKFKIKNSTFCSHSFCLFSLCVYVFYYELPLYSSTGFTPWLEHTHYSL